MDDRRSLALRGIVASAVAALIACGPYVSGTFEGMDDETAGWM